MLNLMVERDDTAIRRISRIKIYYPTGYEIFSNDNAGS